MPVELSNLISELRLDLSDPAGVLFDDVTLGRCLRRGLVRLNTDLNARYAVLASAIEPAPSDAVAELMLLLGQINACQVMRSRTANAFSFSSGDKRVDKTKQPEQWAKLESDLESEYSMRLKLLKPDVSGQNAESYIITPQNITPVIYEQGLDLESDV